MAAPAADQPPANALSAVLARLETALVAVSGAAMALIMVIVTADVLLRYVFNAPLSWSYSLIGLYLVGAVVFLALPDTLHRHGHIALDVLQPRLGLRLRHALLAPGYGAGAVFVALIAWAGAIEARDAFVADDRIAATVAWPTWIAYGLLALGTGAMVRRLVYRALGHAAAALAGRDLVEMPPPPETGSPDREARTRATRHAERGE